jgi:hypothetical protein
MLMKTDNLGVPRFTNQNLIDMIYSGEAAKCHIVLCDPSDDLDKFNAVLEEQGEPPLNMYIPLDVDKSTFDKACQSEWLMPDEYKNIDLFDWLSSRLANAEGKDIGFCGEIDRALAELHDFEKHGMTDLLRYMIYLVDFMRENNIVWGVGRGSSVASYLLYLIGIHKVDSFKHNLDYKEFLR